MILRKWSFVIFCFVISSCNDVKLAAETSSKETHKKLDPSQSDLSQSDSSQFKLDEEDCDDKAKKPIEITPESISLSGDTGCSLDDAH